MKKILILALCAMAGYFAYGMAVFSTAKVNAFLDTLEEDVNKGRTAAACERLSEDVKFTLVDTTGPQERRISGGKEALCRHFAEIAHFYANAAVADNHFKSDLAVRLDWLHFNTARLSYDEHHEITYYPQQTTMRAVSHETLTAIKSGDSYLLAGYEVAAKLE